MEINRTTIVMSKQMSNPEFATKLAAFVAANSKSGDKNNELPAWLADPERDLDYSSVGDLIRAWDRAQSKK